jgi:5-methylcytosine-specific restriction endonuclease McrA
MIENFWVITKAGHLIYKKNFATLNVADELLAGFLSAMDSFMKESTERDIKHIVMRGKKFTYIIENDFIFVLNTEESDNNILIRELLKKIEDQFAKKYFSEIKNFKGRIDPFKTFDSNLEEIIIESDISIKCQTCGKLIFDDFIIKNIGDRTIYLCCESCEKFFSYDKNLDEKEKLRFENMILICSNCGKKRSIPNHCNRPMHLEVIDGKEKLLCWMGPDCGVTDIPTHCGNPMKVESKES